MKKALFSLLALALLLALCACTAEASSVRTVVLGGATYEVDLSAGTISDGTNTYGFSAYGGSANSTVELTYPDGATFSFLETGNGTMSGSASADFIPGRYADPWNLLDVLNAASPAQKAQKPWIWIVLLFAIGAFHLFAPEQAWQLQYGWHFKDAKPSDAALIAYRLSGVLALIVAVVLVL